MLPQPQRDLFGWLIDVLRETLKHPSNAMNVKGLAIIFGPLMIDSSVMTDQDALLSTNLATKIIANILESQSTET